MKAILLSGGFGKRLKPLTDYLPKPLIPIYNYPIIEWQIRYFKKFGINDIIVCAGYKADQVIKYLESKNLGVHLEYSIETEPLGTAGAIKKASKYIDAENFFVINGDILTDIDLNKLKTHSNSVAVIPLRTSFGIVHLDGTKVERFEEKPEMSNYWMNAGVYYLNKNILKHLPKNGNLESTTFPLLSQSGMLHAIKYDRVFWKSVDSYKDMEECESLIKTNKYEKFIFSK
ncbi:MAG: nucleotidyltransferase family protein [Thaumarchaeota archaeon]|nr:nucleotidyltransferase family protein [Nitrososphaerota archaeon]MDE1838544.1 nucleotidyltransferase family protein [Nitrososphaerota archaeon]